jgi:hypothetical protein
MDMGDPSRPVVRWTKLPEPVVDIGERPETFDRWANSTERTVSWNDFVSLFKKGYP